MKMTTSLPALALAFMLGLAAFAPARAESEVSDAKLQAFVAAAVSVTELIEQWSPRIESAESQEAADELLAEANSELIDAIEATDGITVDEYKEISEAAQADPSLSARIEEIFQQQYGE